MVFVWGTTFVSSKVLLNAGISPADIFVVRFTMAYLVMSAVSHKRMWASSWVDELTLLLLGVMGGSLYFLTENYALVYSTTANVSILVSTCPLLTALLCSLFYKNERLTRRQLFGSLLAFVGGALIILNGQLILHLNPLGDALALCAALTWAFYSLFMRRIMGRYSSDFITRKVFFYGVLTVLPYFVFFSPFRLNLSTVSQPLIASNLLFLGIVASTGGYLMWNWVMKRLGAVKATNYIYLQTLVTMVAGAVILNERITLMALSGVIILIVGMTQVLRR